MKITIILSLKRKTTYHGIDIYRYYFNTYKHKKWILWVYVRVCCMCYVLQFTSDGSYRRWGCHRTGDPWINLGLLHHVNATKLYLHAFWLFCRRCSFVFRFLVFLSMVSYFFHDSIILISVSNQILNSVFSPVFSKSQFCQKCRYSHVAFIWRLSLDLPELKHTHTHPHTHTQTNKNNMPFPPPLMDLPTSDTGLFQKLSHDCQLSGVLSILRVRIDSTVSISKTFLPSDSDVGLKQHPPEKYDTACHYNYLSLNYKSWGIMQVQDRLVHWRNLHKWQDLDVPPLGHCFIPQLVLTNHTHDVHKWRLSWGLKAYGAVPLGCATATPKGYSFMKTSGHTSVHTRTGVAPEFIAVKVKNQSSYPL